MKAAAGGGGGEEVVEDESEGEHEFTRHPEAIEAHARGVAVHTNLHVKGIVRAQAFVNYSDLRLKTAIEDIVDAMKILSRLQGKRYAWRADVPGAPRLPLTGDPVSLNE